MSVVNRLAAPCSLALVIACSSLAACSSETGNSTSNTTTGSSAGGSDGAASSSGTTGGSNAATCDDGKQNGGETGIDCGGSCDPCSKPCDGNDCDKVKQAVSEEQFAAIFEMLAPNGSCADICKQNGSEAGNCTMYRSAGAEAFYQVAAEYPDFLSSEDPDTNKLEVAALFSNVIQESGLQEWNTPWQSGSWPPHTLANGAITMALDSNSLNFTTDNATGNPKIAKGLCFSLEVGAPTDSWLGRGPIQLTGESNYAQATYGMSQFNDLFCADAVQQGLPIQNPPKGVGVDVCVDKNKVSSDPIVAWRTALWFWTNMPMSAVSNWGHMVWPKQSCAQVMNSAAGDHTSVAGTIQVINGALECIKGQVQTEDGGTFGKTMRRINNYIFVVKELGLNIDEAKVWSDIMTRCYQGEAYSP